MSRRAEVIFPSPTDTAVSMCELQNMLVALVDVADDLSSQMSITFRTWSRASSPQSQDNTPTSTGIGSKEPAPQNHTPFFEDPSWPLNLELAYFDCEFGRRDCAIAASLVGRNLLCLSWFVSLPPVRSVAYRGATRLLAMDASPRVSRRAGSIRRDRGS